MQPIHSHNIPMYSIPKIVDTDTSIRILGQTRLDQITHLWWIRHTLNIECRRETVFGGVDVVDREVEVVVEVHEGEHRSADGLDVARETGMAWDFLAAVVEAL